MSISLSMKQKIMVSLIALATIPLLVLGLLAYHFAEKGIYTEVTEKLQSQVNFYRDLIDQNLHDAEETTKTAEQNAEMIVKQQAQLVVKMIQSSDKKKLEILKNELAQYQVGKTGYIAVLDYDGNYIVSKDRKTDGANIFQAKDADGKFFVQEMIEKGKRLQAGKIDFQTYAWKNPDEKVARKKIAAIIHIPELKWVVCPSAYFSDLGDTEKEAAEVASFKKKLLAQKVGETGYMFVLNSSGDTLIHPKLEGKNLANLPFIKEMINSKEGVLKYVWEGQEKLVVFSYYPEKDWIIASGSYLSDFMGSVVQIRNIMIMVTLISIGISLTVAFLLANSIANPILRMIQELKEASGQVSSVAKEVAAASENIAQASNEQASSLEETSASLEELSGMIKNNVQNVEKSHDITNKVNSISLQASQSLQELVGSMTMIHESNSEIQKLVGLMEDVKDKTSVIDEIVFQTKLLSFNASVEAERANEHGKGFAVVAQEVGTLARMSGTAANEISGIVKDSIEKARLITEENKKRVNQGTELVKLMAKILDEIKDHTHKVTHSASEILQASQQQSSGIGQINQAVSQLDKATQMNASSSEETASASNELSGQVASLDNIVNRLKGVIEGDKAA